MWVLRDKQGRLASGMYVLLFFFSRARKIEA
jgi:hypothetical protein